VGGSPERGGRQLTTSVPTGSDTRFVPQSLLASELPADAVLSPDGDVECDVAIIGSGMGGATMAYALRNSGARVVLVERGDFLPREWENWSPEDVHLRGRYKNAEQWYDATGVAFSPGVYYYVGGNTKVYGASLPRFREVDFGAIHHPDGLSEPWPVSYAEMEPYYAQAERLYLVHGERDRDPTDPWRSSDYPFPALDHEPSVAALARSLAQQGVRPFSMPTAIDRRPGGRCIRCRTCDGFPCMIDAKGDAEICAVLPALRDGVRLLTRTRVMRLETDQGGGRVTSALAVRDGRELRIRAPRFVLACGAVNTAALLLASGGDGRDRAGLANSSGHVGRNYLVHNSTFMIAVDPRRRNDVRFQKTLGVNDFYLAGRSRPPLGNVQMLGKLQGAMVKPARPRVPMALLDYITAHSVDLYLTTEDVPSDHSFISWRGGRIVVSWKPTNLSSHRQLVRRVSKLMRGAGYPVVLTERMGIATNSHQCGTARMGEDPGRSVVDPRCRAHDVENLWICDTSVFPSSAAVNPALTAAANALRMAALGDLAG
jgi:choline dehydrogenase-like flavoprotein